MNTKILLSIGSMLVWIAIGLANVSAAEGAKSGPQPEAPTNANKSLKELQQDFLKLRFGMFIHFNLETFKGVQWVAGYHSPADFNPGGKVDTDAWANAAVSAGLRSDLLASANWWDWGKKGTPYLDIAVKEIRHFPENNTAPGETCWCLEQGWFWHEGARPKTARQVLDLLAAVKKRNSNFLLNVGPNKQGRFEEASVRVLAEVGILREGGKTADAPQ